MAHVTPNRFFAHDIVHFVMSFPHSGLYNPITAKLPNATMVLTPRHMWKIERLLDELFWILKFYFYSVYRFCILDPELFQIGIEHIYQKYSELPFTEAVFMIMCTCIALWARYAREVSGLQTSAAQAVDLIEMIMGSIPMFRSNASSVW